MAIYAHYMWLAVHPSVLPQRNLISSSVNSKAEQLAQATLLITWNSFYRLGYFTVNEDCCFELVRMRTEMTTHDAAWKNSSTGLNLVK